MSGPLPPSSSNPAIIVIDVTPSNTDDLSQPARAFYVGVTGDVALVTVDGVPHVFKAHPVGYLLAGGRRINATGTTATNILALV